MTKSASQIIEGMYKHFMLIYSLWEQKHSNALARKMLEKDVLLLGLYFGAVDEFGQLAELTLVAECIAYIRIFDAAVDQRKMIDYWTDIAMEELQERHIHKQSSSQSMADIVEQLDTWTLTKDMFLQGKVSLTVAGQMVQHFIELADVFFMRDGNITSEEMRAMGEFEKALSLE